MIGQSSPLRTTRPGGLRSRAIGGTTLSVGSPLSVGSVRRTVTRATRDVTASVRDIAVIPNRFPANPTAEGKLRLVFEELDLNNNRSIELDGFRRVLKALNIEHTSATVDDMYDRMDLNKNGAVSYSEYLNWAANYPSTIDAIYERSRAAIESVRRDAAIETKRSAMEAHGKKERMANADWQAALKDFRTQERNLQALAEDVEQRKADEQMRSRELLEAERDADFARAERNAKEKAHLAAKAEERDAFKPLNAASLNVQKLEDRIQHIQDNVYSLQEKERNLQQMLMDVKKEIQQGNDAIGEATIEVEGAKQHEDELRAIHAEAENVVKDLYAEMQQAETEANRMRDRVNMIAGIRKSALEATKMAEENLQHEKRALIPYKQREEEKRRIHQAAARALEDMDDVVRGMEQEAAAHIQHRSQMEVDEHAILEHEVRLREQRYNLDDRDDIHWDEATRFTAVVGRVDTRSGTVAQSPHRQR